MFKLIQTNTQIDASRLRRQFHLFHVTRQGMGRWREASDDTLKYRSAYAHRDRGPLWWIQVLIKLYCLAELAFLNLHCRSVVSTIARVGSRVSAKPLRIERWTPSPQENNMGLYCELYLTLYKQRRISRLRLFLIRLVSNCDAIMTTETELSVDCDTTVLN